MQRLEILVVDDDVAILKLLHRALSKLGYGVTTTESAEAALDLLAEKRFDLIITDLIMEPVDGFHVLAASKKRYHEVPVVVLTGHRDSKLAVQALKLEADDYLFKPVELENLYYSVSACLEKADLRRKIDRGRKDLELFKSVADFSNEAVAIWEPDGQMIYVNPAYGKLYGISREEALALQYGGFLSEKSAEILESEILPALEDGNGWEGVLESFDAENQRFSLWQRIDVVHDGDGRMNYLFAFMHDFTKEKKDVENSTRMQKMEALGTLAGGIAHEFNNIIWIIDANTELISTYIPEDSPGVKNLERVEKACARAGGPCDANPQLQPTE